jgi:adenosine deaminase
VGVLRVLRALDQWLIRHPDDLHRLAYEYLQDAAAHHVRYAEVFWNPTGTAQQSGVAYPEALAALCRAFADAQADCGIVGRLIPAIDREAPPAAATEMVQWVLQHRRDEVLGIGIDYREVDHPPEDFVDAYALARRHGLKTTAHAGEFGMPWTNVRTAVEVLQCDRIDHGYTVVDAPDYARECAERGIVFTVVPTNSYYLRTLAATSAEKSTGRGGELNAVSSSMGASSGAAAMEGKAGGQDEVAPKFCAIDDPTCEACQ